MANVFNSFIRFHGSKALIQLNGVRSGVNLYVGGDQHIVADGDPVAVHECAARIDGDVVSDMDVAAVIADEGMADGDLGADAAQHFLQHLPLFLLMVVRQGIVFHQEPVRLVFEFQKHLVMAVIPFARHAFSSSVIIFSFLDPYCRRGGAGPPAERASTGRGSFTPTQWKPGAWWKCRKGRG